MVDLRHHAFGRQIFRGQPHLLLGQGPEPGQRPRQVADPQDHDLRLPDIPVNLLHFRVGGHLLFVLLPGTHRDGGQVVGRGIGVLGAHHAHHGVGRQPRHGEDGGQGQGVEVQAGKPLRLQVGNEVIQGFAAGEADLGAGPGDFFQVIGPFPGHGLLDGAQVFDTGVHHPQFPEVGVELFELLFQVAPPGDGRFFKDKGHDLGQGGVFHVVQPQAVGLEGPVTPHVIGHPVGFLAHFIKGHIGKHIHGTQQFAFGQLVAGGDHPGRAVKAAGDGVLKGHRHQGAMMGAPHPALHQVGKGEGFQDLAHCGHARLATHDHHRVVFAHVAPGQEAQLLGRGRGHHLVVFFAIDVFDEVATRGADQHQQVVHVLGA